ncbi:MAG TPA: serine/threonine-protein kinase [Gemmatimonadaceae bacterium]|nr:serine/threonine-protein kinase [Gemmatimonadaceae bacterium]
MTDYLHDRVVAAVGNQYLIEGEIGRGGMAAVFRALDLRLHRHVAIKALPPELAFNGDVRTRFLREAQTAAQLSHPNIVPIYTVDERGGVVYFVMALVEGESLAARLSRQPRLSVEAVRRILAEVADALDYAHACSVVHRDIKPDNILIDRTTGRAVVTDFGIARAAVGDARLTLTGVAVGTPAYMSPEQAMGERDVDGRSDQYSLGVVGYQMLVGQPPFKAANTPAMLMKHLSEIPRPVCESRPDVPESLAVTIDRALSKKPEDRWPSAGAFRDALTTAVASVPAPVAPATPPAPSTPNGAGRLDALRPGEALRRAMNLGDDVLPSLPQLPGSPLGIGTGMTRREWKEWARQQRRLARDMARGAIMSADEGRDFTAARWYDIERRVLRFRRRFVQTVVLVPTLFMINAAMRGVPWFVFPSGFLLLTLLTSAGNLWADGISPVSALRTRWRQRIRDALGLPDVPASPPAPVSPMLPPPDAAAALVPPEVLGGAHGGVVRRAVADSAQIRDIISKLSQVEREMLPDVAPTIDGLVERVASLAITLQRLDADVSGTSLGALDERIALAERDTRDADNDRRLALLRRQRTTLHDLLERRRTLLDQMESAGLTLQNLKLDLLKLRSAGVGSAIEDVTSATREARALSRDIEHLLDAADDVRKL